MPQLLSLTIKTLDGVKLSTHIDRESTIESAREHLCDIIGYDKSQNIKLIHSGKVLKNINDTFEDYLINNNDVIVVMKCPEKKVQPIIEEPQEEPQENNTSPLDEPTVFTVENLQDFWRNPEERDSANLYSVQDVHAIYTPLLLFALQQPEIMYSILSNPTNVDYSLMLPMYRQVIRQMLEQSHLIIDGIVTGTSQNLSFGPSSSNTSNDEQLNDTSNDEQLNDTSDDVIHGTASDIIIFNNNTQESEQPIETLNGNITGQLGSQTFVSTSNSDDISDSKTDDEQQYLQPFDIDFDTINNIMNNGVSDPDSGTIVTSDITSDNKSDNESNDEQHLSQQNDVNLDIINDIINNDVMNEEEENNNAPVPSINEKSEKEKENDIIQLMSITNCPSDVVINVYNNTNYDLNETASILFQSNDN
jgi:hypothetical protein